MTHSGAATQAGTALPRMAVAFELLVTVLLLWWLLDALPPQWWAVSEAIDGLPWRFVLARLLELFTLLVLLRWVARLGLGAADIGLHWCGARRSLAVALVWTLPLMACLYLLATHAALSASVPLGLDWSRLDWTYATYALVVPLQELMARGMLQSALERLLPWPGPIARWGAVVLAALLFALWHWSFGVPLALVSLFSGLLWGGLFALHRNLLGVSVSHFLLGNWAGVLGLWTLWS
ncbi:CPBP family intramembrane glutamic endopeptidase [Simplicispira metamorpha]|uniref:CAAX prenyl protease-like protein n=1 Tax=Simplicispira metamorpha TaxID=80881 RepID=A0A4R2NGG2_9BURK|nr:CPBP family intramembrane glutamic endopeptidase [Simplicispira metamorpha]TCP20417.1 CAAX prenyl protease-like protein [Simplicispira metamorpha]